VSSSKAKDVLTLKGCALSASPLESRKHCGCYDQPPIGMYFGLEEGLKSSY
jgi:hypothetical protein